MTIRAAGPQQQDTMHDLRDALKTSRSVAAPEFFFFLGGGELSPFPSLLPFPFHLSLPFPPLKVGPFLSFAVPPLPLP